METTAITLDRNGGVARLTLNRPDQRNAMSAALVKETIAVLHSLADEDAAGAVVLSGAGRGFCAGSDLTMLAAMTAGERSAFEADSGRLADTIWALPIPVIAAVDGFAVGGGLTLAACCDVIVTTRGAKWSLPEVPIGLFPAWGIEYVTRRVGPVASRRLCYGLDTLSGEEAAALGLADLVDDDPAAKAMSIAENLAAMPRGSVGAVKRYFADPAQSGDPLANRLFGECADSDAGRACFTRFGADR